MLRKRARPTLRSQRFTRRRPRGTGSRSRTGLCRNSPDFSKYQRHFTGPCRIAQEFVPVPQNFLRADLMNGPLCGHYRLLSQLPDSIQPAPGKILTARSIISYSTAASSSFLQRQPFAVTQVSVCAKTPLEYLAVRLSAKWTYTEALPAERRH